MNKRRLLKLADFLETKVPPTRFNFNRWVGYDWKGADDISCGTSACALGWATQMPEFRKLGLRLVLTEENIGGVQLSKGRGGRRPRAAGPLSMRAAMRLFGLTNKQAEYLFVPHISEGGPGAEATPVVVANHIRRFVECNGIRT
jgi:hypothetical protein